MAELDAALRRCGAAAALRRKHFPLEENVCVPLLT
jgi:hypothetical protein